MNSAEKIQTNETNPNTKIGLIIRNLRQLQRLTLEQVALAS